MLAAAFGFAKVVWTWRTASRAEQLLCVAIVINIAVYVISTMPSTFSSREIAAVLPCGAVLAARACVPGRIVGAWRARAVLAAAALVALLPLAAAATLPPVTPAAVPLAAWLEAHGLTYGIAGYWDASAVTVQSGNRVQVRAVDMGKKIFVPYWETSSRIPRVRRYDAQASRARRRPPWQIPGRRVRAALRQASRDPPSGQARLVLDPPTNLLRSSALP